MSKFLYVSCLHYIQTYIIGYYNPTVRIIDLVSHTTYVVCANFYTYVAGPRLRTTDFFKIFSWEFYLLPEFLPEICCEEIAEEILFIFCFDVRPGARILAFRLISQHTTVHPLIRIKKNDYRQF